MTQFSDGRLTRHEAARLAGGHQNPSIQDDLREILDWLDAKAPTQAHKAERARLRAWLDPAPAEKPAS